MRINEENRRRNGHVLVWDQPELTLDDKKSKSKIFSSSHLIFSQKFSTFCVSHAKIHILLYSTIIIRNSTIDLGHRLWIVTNLDILTSGWVKIVRFFPWKIGFWSENWFSTNFYCCHYQFLICYSRNTYTPLESSVNQNDYINNY